MIKIGLDAMGGDFAPVETVKGALLAAEKFSDIEITLYGDESRINECLKDGAPRIKVIHCEDAIEMDVKDPALAVRRQKDASLVVATKAVKSGEIQAVVSAGATGALIAAGTLVVKRLKQVARPALTVVMPTIKKGQHTILCDAGATSEIKAEYMHQNAKIANIYAREVMGIQNPKIGLLNIGTEESKGTEAQQEAFKLLSVDKTLNFIGNIESKEMISGEIDIIVSDGYSGNIALKAVEGTAKSIFSLLKEEIMSSTSGKIGGLLLKGVFKKIKGTMDAKQVGGAILLGVSAPVIKAHGSSDAVAIMNAIRQARESVKQDIVGKMVTALNNE